MFLQIALLIAGFALLLKGADWLVDGAAFLARKYRVPELAIGLTIVAFGTSAPELVVNTFAAEKGNAAIVYGNVIGSNNFNLFVILGIAALITPLKIHINTVRREIPLSLLAVLVLFLLTDNLFSREKHLLSRIDGLILLLFFAAFLYYVYLQLKKDRSAKGIPASDSPGWKIALLILAGLGGLMLGGRLVVDQAQALARALGVSEKIIALTIVAMGTSLPELATSLLAAIKKNNDIAIGNIIGSNIFNIFLILGVSAVIRPIPYDLSFNRELLLLGAGTILLLLAMLSGQKKQLDRWEAAVLLALYVAYTVLLIVRA
ncbi:MAG: calcium/sodium antiporter [Candidatus Marinimicrobia bacterium]|nr:calcium/sodium antiporter [Candidatus Neomarinimicrobiota bacterium]